MRQLFGSTMPRRAPSSGRAASLRGQIDLGLDSIRTGRCRYPLVRTLGHPDGDRHAFRSPRAGNEHYVKSGMPDGCNFLAGGRHMTAPNDQSGLR